MALHAQFLATTEKLRMPAMGTDSIAPLLYYLLRWLRSEHVLEIGMGYTTPFIAQALYDNMIDFQQERKELARKNNVQTKTHNDSSSTPLSSLTPDEESWLASTSSLLRPAYYQEYFQPKLHTIDDFSSLQSSASQVAEVLKLLNLSPQVEIHNEDYHKVRAYLGVRFDLIWVDCSQSAFIFDDFWDLLKKGGFFLVHSLLSDKGGNAVLRYFVETVISSGGAIEVLNLFEPHKLYQSGVTILRRRS